MKLEVL
jgi:ABC transporter substrate binding protein